MLCSLPNITQAQTKVLITHSYKIIFSIYVFKGYKEDEQLQRTSTITRTKKPKGMNDYKKNRLNGDNDNLERLAVPTRIQPKRGLQQSNKEDSIPEKKKLL